jgi:uncharacterized protein YfiM (DUF2279 family)
MAQQHTPVAGSGNPHRQHYSPQRPSFNAQRLEPRAVEHFPRRRQLRALLGHMLKALAMAVGVGSAIMVLGFLAGLIAGQAHAGPADSWTGPDKALHFAGGAAVASAVTAATGNERTGLLAGVGLGVAKELADAASRHGTPSWRDAIVTALGAYVGTKTTGLLIGPRHIVVRIRF